MARPATAAVRLLTGEREPVRLATTANLATVKVSGQWMMYGLQTIDGVLTKVGDRILVKDQTDATLNAIYTASEGYWYRAADARTSRTLQKGTTVRTQVGAVNASRMFEFTTDEPVIGTDDIVVTFDAADHSSYVTLSGAETLTNKTINGGTIASATLTLKQSAAPTPTAEGDIQWDTDDNRIVVGEGAESAQAVFAKGPATTVDNTVPRFDGTKGATQTSGVTIDDSDKVTASGGFYVGSARVGGAPDAVLEDQKASGTGGGTFTSGAWRTRDLNTEVYDPASLVTIAANEFTPTVDGWIEWRCPAGEVGSHKTRLFNVTGAVAVAYGSSEIDTLNNEASVRSSEGGAQVSAGVTYRIEHMCQTTKTDGFGLACSFAGAIEVYTRVKFWRTA